MGGLCYYVVKKSVFMSIRTIGPRTGTRNGLFIMLNLIMKCRNA
jgi:hypothetical protein